MASQRLTHDLYNMKDNIIGIPKLLHWLFRYPKEWNGIRLCHSTSPKSTRRNVLANTVRTEIILILLATSLYGCAGMTAEMDSLHEIKERGFSFSSQSQGFRYYESATYILVYTNNNGGLETKVLTLPDLDRKMSVRPYSYIASQTVEMSFANGMLGAATADADATAVPKAILGAAQQAASAAAKAGLLDAPTDEVAKAKIRTVPGPYLFKLVLVDEGGKKKLRLVGGENTDLMIAIPLQGDEGTKNK